jgi:hypothetical protein
MKVYPDRYKAYTIDGKNVFPVYGGAGLITSSCAAILIKGDPPLKGGDFGTIRDEVVSLPGGAWIVVTFNHSDDETTVAHKVAKAEKLLDPVS